MSTLKKESEIVVTINGSTALKSECRRISGEFYKIGDINIIDSGQCYLINNKYYKVSTGYITFDYTIEKYVIKNNTTLMQGVVGFKGEDLIFGYFSYNDENNLPIVVDKQGDQYRCVNDTIFEGSAYQFNLHLDKYANRLSRNVEEFISPGVVSREVKNRLPYDSRGGMGDLIANHNNYKPVLSEATERYGDILGDLTFGVEFETVRGSLAASKCRELGLMALRDGSVGGLEYATIPLQGKKGIQTLINSIDALRDTTEYDNSCSLHFHIGNIPRTEEFFLALFKVLCTVENQMYEIFPLYKKYNFGVKRKHYTKPFPMNETMFQLDKVINKDNVKSNFATLFRFLSMGQSYTNVDNDLKNVHYHPSDPNGTSKWNIRSRYHWVNLIPLLFGNKQTVEFRLHTPTYETEKVMHYLMLCASIVNFVKNNTKAILEQPSILQNLNTTDIVYKWANSIKKNNSNATRFADFSYEYFRDRKDYFYRESTKGKFNSDEDDFLFRKRIKWSDVNNNSVILSKIKTSRSRSQNGKTAPTFDEVIRTRNSGLTWRNRRIQEEPQVVNMRAALNTRQAIEALRDVDEPLI